jgi:CRP-like cAMP-binding protein
MITIMSTLFDSLFDGAHLIEIDQDKVLFHARDNIKYMHQIVEGRVELVRHMQSGSRIILQAASDGQVLAEASAYCDTYHCDGLAVEASKVRSISVTVFLERLDQDTGLSRAWAGHLAYGAQAARMSAEIRSLRTVAERLDAWLGEGRLLPPKGQWQDLADVLSVSREALYRELAKRR